MKKIAIGGIIIILIVAGWFAFNNNKFGAPVNPETTLLSDFAADKVSISFDTGNEVVLYSGEAATSMSAGDIVQFFNNDGDGTIVPMDIETYYYVTSASPEGFQINPTFASAALDLTTAATGGEYVVKIPKGTVVGVKAGSRYVVSVYESLASADIQFVCSVQGQEPTVIASKSTDNRWDTCDVFDLQNGTSIDGDTGVAITSGQPDVRQFEFTGDSLNWIGVLIKGLETGTIGIKAQVSD